MFKIASVNAFSKMIEFGKRLSEIRKRLKLTQSQFAELVRLSEDSIGKLERGTSQPTIDTLEKISEGLNIPISDLIGEKATTKEKGPALENLAAYLKTKTQEEIEKVHKIAIIVLEK